MMGKKIYEMNANNNNNRTTNYRKTTTPMAKNASSFDDYAVEYDDNRETMSFGSGSGTYSNADGSTNGVTGAGIQSRNHYMKYKATNIVHDILLEQDLSRASLLFSLNNHLILDDFPITIEILKSIIDTKAYVNNLNQQSIVEIILTKCISALRETKMISSYYDDLLEIIELCLKYNLNSASATTTTTTTTTNYQHKSSNHSTHRSSFNNKYDSDKQQQLCSINTPHANIVSDILSCILLDYLDEDLSIKAIPVCIKILHHHSVKRELLREIISYLNLIACRSPELLIDYVYYILSGMLKGHTGLANLLYQICEANVECIYPLVKHLIKGLKLIESTNELIYVLQIMYLVSLNHVQLIIVYLDDLIGYLPDVNLQEYLLDILYSVANQMPIALERYLTLFDDRLLYDSYKLEKIISAVGKSLKKQSEYCTELLMKRIKYLIEVHHKRNKALASANSSSRVTNADKRGVILESDPDGDYIDLTDENDDHMMTLDSSTMDHHRQVKSSFDYYFNDSRRNRHHETELKSNNKTAATAAAAASAGSYFTQSEQQQSLLDYKLNTRIFQILSEIYEIAQVFPYVLDFYLDDIYELVQETPENVFLIDKLKELQIENSPKICSNDDMNQQTESSNQLNKKLNDALSRDNDIGNLSMSFFHNHNETKLPSARELMRVNSADSIENEKRLDDFASDPKNSDLTSSTSSASGGSTSTTTKSSNSKQSSRNNEATEMDVCSAHSNQNAVSKENDLNVRPIVPCLQLNSNNDESAKPSLDSDKNLNVSSVVELPVNGIDAACCLKDDVERVEKNLNQLMLTSSSFVNNLTSKMNESSHPISSTMRISNTSNYLADKDVVERFCTKHFDKIKDYVNKLVKLFPMPELNDLTTNPDMNTSTINQNTSMLSDQLNRSYVNNSNSLFKKFKIKKVCNLKFYCSKRCEHCCLFNNNYFEMTTYHPSTWIHIIFLYSQVLQNRPMKQQDKKYQELKQAYEKLNEKLPFTALVTSSFPQQKQLNEILKELNDSRIFDLFECKHKQEEEEDTELSALEDGHHMANWQCYLCSNPDKLLDLSMESKPLIQGQLKEKHGKLKFLRRWNKRIFTLTGGSIVYFKKDMRQESLNVRYIRNIQTISSSFKSGRNLPKAFEIFTDTNSFLLKAPNGKDAAQWIQYLQLSKAIDNTRGVLSNDKYSTLVNNKSTL